MFADEKFDKFRELITRSGRNGNGKSFNSIDGDALSEALEGLEGDDLALAELVSGAINSDDVHVVEFLNEDDKSISSEGTEAILGQVKELKNAINSEGKLGKWIVDSRGGGLNVATENGSHSFVSTSATGKERSVLTGHELLGHGLPSAKGIAGKGNNENAVRAENLIRRVMRMGQWDGTGHTPQPSTDPYLLPMLK